MVRAGAIIFNRLLAMLVATGFLKDFLKELEEMETRTKYQPDHYKLLYADFIKGKSYFKKLNF